MQGCSNDVEVFVLMLPSDRLRKIVLDLVYDEGDGAFLTLSLACKRFYDIANNQQLSTITLPGKTVSVVMLRVNITWSSSSPDVDPVIGYTNHHWILRQWEERGVQSVLCKQRI